MNLPSTTDFKFLVIAILTAVALLLVLLGIRQVIRERRAINTPELSTSDPKKNTGAASAAERVTVAQAVAERDTKTTPIPQPTNNMPARHAGPDTTPAPTTVGGSTAGTPANVSTTQVLPVISPAPTSVTHPGGTPEQGAPDSGQGASAPAPESGIVHTPDVRDRLLAVLLDNPTQAVEAMMELDGVHAHLNRLTQTIEAIRRERGVLGEILNRLTDTGLRPQQLAKLTELPLPEVHELLRSTQQSHDTSTTNAPSPRR